MGSFKAKNALLTLAFSLLFLFGVAVCLIPTVLSTATGNRTAVKLINRQLEGKAEIRHIALSWIGPQKISGLVTKDASQEIVASCQKVVIESPLLPLLFGKLQQSSGSFTGLNISKPFAAIHDAKGTFTFLDDETINTNMTGIMGNKEPFQLALICQLDKARPGYALVDVKFGSSIGTVDGAFAVDKSIHLNNMGMPIKFLWKADPAQKNFTHLMHLPESTEKLTALKPFKIRGLISALDIPLEGNFWDDAKLAMDLKIAELHLHSEHHDEELYFKKVMGHIQKNKENKLLTYQLKAEAGDAENLHGDLEVKGMVDKDFSLKAEAKGTKLPIALLAALSPSGSHIAKQLKALFGKGVNIQAKALLKKGNGPLQASILGDNGSFFLDSYIQEGNLMLKKPLTLQTKATPELGRDLLHPIFPLFTSMVAAEAPLHLEINPQEFVLPLKNPSTANIAIGDMRVDLGIMHFQNKGKLAKLFKPFTANNNPLLTLWFTPLHLKMHRGIVSLKRIDMLVANSIAVAAWGKINLIRDTLDMKVGVSTESLPSSMQALSPFVVLPLQGKIDNPSLDLSPLKLSLVSNMAKQFGQKDNATSQTFRQNNPQKALEIPPPSISPLPWETTMTAEAKTPQGAPPKRSKEKFKSLGKQARSFIKKALAE